MSASVYSFTVRTNKGKEQSLEAYAGKVLLVVNTASECGLTPQYKELQELYGKHRDRGLEILAFPCNQFGQQEPGSNEEIQTFCETNYGVTFPLFDKVDVNGEHAAPLYQHLKREAPGPTDESADIPWNFTKFLVDRTGRVVRRFEPKETASLLEPELLKLL